jgi:serine phosphatase RsbU (regulator of sigma subunit)
MKRNFQITITISVILIFEIGYCSLAFLSQKYTRNKLIIQIIDDNLVIGNQMVTLLKKTGLTDENPETDSLLQEICDKIKLPNGGFICIINKYGNLIAAPGLKSGMSMQFKPEFQDINKIKPRFQVKSLSNDIVFTGYAYFAEEDRLDLVASIPMGENLRLFVHQNSTLISQKAWESIKPLMLFSFIICFFAAVIIHSLLKRKVQLHESDIEEKNEEIKAALLKLKEAKIQIELKNSELQIQYFDFLNIQHRFSSQNKEIYDSIQNAQKIQGALLPKSNIDGAIINSHFILFMPKDVVSGDFYWYHSFGDIFYIAVADCTGHGIPGALMSILGINFLNEIIIEKRIKDPGIILEYMRRSIVKALGQEYDKKSTLDGINMSLCVINKSARILEYAAANSSIICLRENETIQLKGDRMPVGIHLKMEEEFKNQSFQMQTNDILYLFTDGFSDQLGGSQARKFMLKNFRNLLLELKDIPMLEQKNILERSIVEWKGSYPQVDDITVIGLKIN